MDRCHSSVISKGSSTTYSIPNSTQHDARQRCPALIVLKEENNNKNRKHFFSHRVIEHWNRLPQHVVDAAASQLVTWPTRHTVNSAYSQLGADIVGLTKHCIFIITPYKQSTKTKYKNSSCSYRIFIPVPLQTITTRHSNRKQTTDGTAIAYAYSEREGCQSTRHTRVVNSSRAV